MAAGLQLSLPERFREPRAARVRCHALAQSKTSFVSTAAVSLDDGTAVLVSLALACLQDVPDRENSGALADGSSESSVSGPAHFKRFLLPAAVSHNPKRLIYPYSVIPGGVRSVQELKLAILADHSIASHYSAFDFSKFRIIRLEAEKTAYVAYRVHNEIFWTKKKLKLRTGEELITDGVHYARLRCGNLISEDDPHGETSPKE